jgi:gamma-glutamyl hydrolase
MSKINGVLLPGGGLQKDKPHGYSDASEAIMNIATEMNSQGEYFPVFGIGTGMEMMLYHTSNREDIMEPCNIGSASVSLTLSKKG